VREHRATAAVTLGGKNLPWWIAGAAMFVPKELERENARLKRAVANMTLDKLILEEAAKGNF